MDADNVVELLFFDTFSHDASEEINLDLVQFPKPAIISEIRVIPLGARVQADFPGGVRLGATNPSKFSIEFFVNDLSKHGASTFESLGGLEYSQTQNIHFECAQKVPTDGLVLRGWYTTITLAVYGSLSKSLPRVYLPDPRAGELSASAATAQWVQNQQPGLYRDPNYSYPPDYTNSQTENTYTETWNAVTPNNNLNHDRYDPALPPNWEHPPAPDEGKQWSQKDDISKAGSPIRSENGSCKRQRHDFWDERERRPLEDEPKRFKENDVIDVKEGERRRERSPDRLWRETSESRSRSKPRREPSWDKENDKSPYSEGGNFRRRPKSPASRSPKRPSTPTDKYWSPERRDYRSPGGRHRSSPRPSSPSKSRVEHLRVDVTGSPQTPLHSPGIGMTSLEEEQFEPILSDEDIVDESDLVYPDGEDDSQDELELNSKTFNPYSFEMTKLENLKNPSKTPCESLKVRNEESLDSVKHLLEFTALMSDDSWISALEEICPLLPSALACTAVEDELLKFFTEWVNFGLNLTAALEHLTPGSKIRHIKGGIRLTETLCKCGLASHLIKEANILQKLLHLFSLEYMALSIRLQIIRALDCTLLDQDAIKMFTNDKWSLEVDGKREECTTYQQIIRLLQMKQQVRIKYALTCLMQKIHADEVLEKLNAIASDMVEERNVDEADLVNLIEAARRFYMEADSLLSQPLKFLPVQSQFEVRLDPELAYLFLYRCFCRHNLLKCLLVFFTSRRTWPSIQGATYEFLREIVRRSHGLLFLGSNPTTTTALFKALQAAEDPNDQSSCGLSVQLPAQLQILNCFDKFVGASEESEALNAIHDLLSLILSPNGKSQITSVLANHESFQVLLKRVNEFGEKSVVLSYIGDLIELTVRYSDETQYIRPHTLPLLKLASSEIVSNLPDIVPWIRMVEVLADDLSGLCEILKKCSSTEFNGRFDGELIMCVRLLKTLCISPKAALPELLDCERTPYKEWRFKNAALQLYSLDGMSYLVTILSKMVSYFEQPFVYSANFIGSQGFNLVSFVEPAILLLRCMLSYLIEARGAEYKDVTQVTTLVEVYTLMKAVPVAAEAHARAQSVCRQIVETLLLFTHSSAQVEVYAKSLWSLMLSDILKFIMKAPYCFMPGFELLSELLPLPLPMQCRRPLSDSEVAELRSARQLWSAHFHPLAGQLHDLLAALGGASYPPLLQLMRRVAEQLADLAAPTALVLARGVLDPLLAVLTRTGGGWETPVPPYAARLLNFLACLVPNPAVKVAVLSLITPGANARTDERLLTVVDALTHVLCTPGATQAHIQAQECILLIIQTLLDGDVSLVPPNGSLSGLANGLPARQLLSNLTTALLDYISAPEHPLPCLLLALKPLILLTDNDYGFYRLKLALESRRDAIHKLLERLAGELTSEYRDALNMLHGILALLREFVLDAPTPLRTLTMTTNELGRVLQWGLPDHPLLKIHKSLKEWSTTNESLNIFCDSAGDLVKLLSSSDPESVAVVPKEDEPICGPALPLIEQFAIRPVFLLGDLDMKTLSRTYWFSVPVTEDCDLESDQTPCDLLELCNNFLPDFHLSHEVQRVCRLKTPEENGKKSENNKYQLSGTKTKRPFVTPMRGRGGRPSQQRGDLFRSRPPNTSRPPSLHVDDFVALETCGQQPTGPTGYNKVSVRNVKEVIGNRVRGRGRVFGSSPYPRRESPRPISRGRCAWLPEDIRQPTARLRSWQGDDLRRIHPFPR